MRRLLRSPEHADFVTIAEAAALLGVSQPTLRRWDALAKFRARRHPINGYRMYLRAEVLYIVDEPERPPEEDVERLLEMQKEMLQLLGANAEVPDADDKQLTLTIAAAMPFDLEMKQKLLASRSEPQRVTALIEYYERVLPGLRRAVKARRRAGGNGHV